MEIRAKLPNHGELLQAVLSGFADAAALEISTGVVPAGPTADTRYVPDRDERWQLPHETLRLGYGDCEDFVIWRVGSLRASGEDPGAQPCVVRTGARVAHCMVRRSDGSLEDPAGPAEADYLAGKGLALGMRTAVVDHRTPSKDPAVQAARAESNRRDTAASAAAYKSGQPSRLSLSEEIRQRVAQSAAAREAQGIHEGPSSKLTVADVSRQLRKPHESFQFDGSNPDDPTAAAHGLVLVQEDDGTQRWRHPTQAESDAWAQGVDPTTGYPPDDPYGYGYPYGDPTQYGYGYPPDMGYPYGYDDDYTEGFYAELAARNTLLNGVDNFPLPTVFGAMSMPDVVDTGYYQSFDLDDLDDGNIIQAEYEGVERE